MPQRLARPNGLTELYLDAAALQVAHRNGWAVARFDHHVVASQLRPTRCCPAALGEGITNGRQPTEGVVIRRGVMHADYHALDGREDGAPEAWKPLRMFGTQEGPERDRCGAPSLVDWDEVDRKRRSEQGGAVAWHSIGGAVLGQPAALERVCQVHCWQHSEPSLSVPWRSHSAAARVRRLRCPCRRLCRRLSGRLAAERRTLATPGSRL